MGLFNTINKNFSAVIESKLRQISSRQKRLAFLLMGWAFVLIGSFAISLWADNVPTRSVKRAWEITREALTSSDSVVREQAVQGLEFVEGEAADRGLHSALSDESDYVRIRAARVLARRGDNSGKQAMLTLLTTTAEIPKNDNSPLSALLKMKALALGRVRGEAAKVLGLMGDRDVVPTLKIAKRDNDGRVRDGAAVALARLGDVSEEYVFASALKENDRGVRLAAVEALGDIGDAKSAHPVSLLLDDAEEEVRAAACKSLGQMHAIDYADPVKKLLMDTSGMVRENAARALGEMGAVSAIPVLKTTLQDTNVYNQLAAAEALAKMKDPSGLSVVETALDSNDVDNRVKAAGIFGFFADRAAQSLAIKTLDDGNIRVRLGAALGLLRMDQRKK